jgi:hypothetical protein
MIWLTQTTILPLVGSPWPGLRAGRPLLRPLF